MTSSSLNSSDVRIFGFQWHQHHYNSMTSAELVSNNADIVRIQWRHRLCIPMTTSLLDSNDVTVIQFWKMTWSSLESNNVIIFGFLYLNPIKSSLFDSDEVESWVSNDVNFRFRRIFLRILLSWFPRSFCNSDICVRRRANLRTCKTVYMPTARNWKKKLHKLCLQRLLLCMSKIVAFIIKNFVTIFFYMFHL